MHNTMSQTESPRSAPTVTLRRIWSVRADGSYEVSHAPRADETTIALRTMEGEGVIELKNGTFSPRADSLLLFSSSDIRRYGTKDNFWHFYWFEFECPSLLLPLCRPMTVTDPSEDWPELCYAALSDSGRSAYVSKQRRGCLPPLTEKMPARLRPKQNADLCKTIFLSRRAKERRFRSFARFFILPPHLTAPLSIRP